MSLRCVGLVYLFLVFEAALSIAQSFSQFCLPPVLPDGFFHPMQNDYPPEAMITYACDEGHKPVADGWWATSRCQSNKWIPEPKCIDDNFCIAPTVPNSKQPRNSLDAYENEYVLRISCEKGFDLKDNKATAQCENGTWSTLPVCERDADACNAPPKVPHAIIVSDKRHGIYPVDSRVMYECEDGYTPMQGDATAEVFCIYGIWTETPVCKKITEPHPPTKSPVGDKTDKMPGSSGSDSQVDRCGDPPTVDNAEVDGIGTTVLTYECNVFYKLMGPRRVVCSTDGTWSSVPYCKAEYCELDTRRNRLLEPSGVKYIKYGEKLRVECKDVYWFNNYSMVSCNDGELHISRCCNLGQIKTGMC